MDRGLYVDRTEAEKSLLSDLIHRYLREVTPGKRGAGPEESQPRALQWCALAQIKKAALSSAHIASYRDERIKQLSAGTVNNELNHLAHAIETGHGEWGVQLPENPVRMVRRPSPSKPAIDDFGRVRKSGFGKPSVAALAISCCCGLV
ncbi:hypothetical protein NB696_001774 [Xanthomonas sacchari]|uniref:hypothetical protein n=1 Tax=Xanthomonas sacchari TaxID=56458 RepID=UPI0022520AA2|nr:hypothetical protein [Xanthomonas sacchari]MCW0395730.1 hypothetical protein [Xanthomonas sacchari]MCW0444902.1 hypothetical protein [Xanthomonas sacchari]